MKKNPVRFPEGFPWELSTPAALNLLLHLGKEGRLVGVNIYKAMNRCLRDISTENILPLATAGEVDILKFTVRQSQFLQWEITDGNRYVRIIDLKKWAPRSWKQGDCPVTLYRDIVATGRAFGVRPRMFYSLSQMAAPILRTNNVVEHLPPKGWELEDLSEEAFHVGRIQACRIGHLEKSKVMYEYDLNSAYAWGLSKVPSLRDCTIEEGEPTEEFPWALQRVGWDTRGKSSPVKPFPVRWGDGSIRYPECWVGWYWSPMVEEARRHFPVTIHKSFRLETYRDTLPFAFLGDLYENRGKIKRPNQRSIAKGTLSAIWGKTCERSRGKFRPRYRSLAWSGMATSVVNSALLRAAMVDPKSVWGFYCDCIIADKMLDVNIGDGLGQWKVSRYTDVQYYQPGVFRGKDEIGNWKERTRGIPAGGLDWDYARLEWDNYGIHGRVPTSWEEFVGLSSLADGSEDWLSSRQVLGSVWLRPGVQAFSRDWLRDGAGKNRSCEDLR